MAASEREDPQKNPARRHVRARRRLAESDFVGACTDSASRPAICQASHAVGLCPVYSDSRQAFGEYEVFRVDVLAASRQHP